MQALNGLKKKMDENKNKRFPRLSSSVAGN